MNRPDYPAILERLSRELDPEPNRRESRVGELVDSIELICLDSTMKESETRALMALVEEIVGEYQS